MTGAGKIGRDVVVLLCLCFGMTATSTHAETDEDHGIGVDGVTFGVVGRGVAFDVAGDRVLEGVTLHGPSVGLLVLGDGLLLRAEWSGLAPSLLRSTPLVLGTRGLGQPGLYLDGSAFPRTTVGAAVRVDDLAFGGGVYGDIVTVDDCHDDACHAEDGRIAADLGAAVDAGGDLGASFSWDAELAAFVMFTGDGRGHDVFGGGGIAVSGRFFYRLDTELSLFVAPQLELRRGNPALEGTVIGLQLGVGWSVFPLLRRNGVSTP